MRPVDRSNPALLSTPPSVLRLRDLPLLRSFCPYFVSLRFTCRKAHGATLAASNKANPRSRRTSWAGTAVSLLQVLALPYATLSMRRSGI